MIIELYQNYIKTMYDLKSKEKLSVIAHKTYINKPRLHRNGIEIKMHTNHFKNFLALIKWKMCNALEKVYIC